MDKSEWQEKGEGHRQRLRDKFFEQGIEAFTDGEVIELLLTFGTPRSDCKEAARTALAQFKTLPAVLDASPVQLQQVKGIGPKEYLCPPVYSGGGPALPPPANCRQTVYPLLPRGGRLSDPRHAGICSMRS